MVNKIKLAFKKLSNYEPSFDPSKFDDEIAMKTSWEPLRKGGSNFQTHRLVEVNYTRIEFKSTLGAKLFGLLFLLVGIGIPTIMGWQVINEVSDIYQFEFLIILIFGSIFAIVGGLVLYSFAKPIVFDRSLGLFWRGWVAPKRYAEKMKEGFNSRIGDIYALQIIPELVRSKDSKYVSFELNLVLRDGTRMNVVDHGNPLELQRDAKIVADFLGVPIWDVT